MARESKSSANATSLARTEEMSWSLVQSSLIFLDRSESWLERVLSWLVNVTIPETVVPRLDKVEPSLAEMVWRACRVRFGTRVGSK